MSGRVRLHAGLGAGRSRIAWFCAVERADPARLQYRLLNLSSLLLRRTRHIPLHSRVHGWPRDAPEHTRPRVVGAHKGVLELADRHSKGCCSALRCSPLLSLIASLLAFPAFEHCLHQIPNPVARAPRPPGSLSPVPFIFLSISQHQQNISAPLDLSTTPTSTHSPPCAPLLSSPSSPLPSW